MLNVPEPKLVVVPPFVTTPPAMLKVPDPKLRFEPLFVTAPEML